MGMWDNSCPCEFKYMFNRIFGKGVSTYVYKYMYVCVCMCAYVCVCVCMYVCVCVCVTVQRLKRMNKLNNYYFMRVRERERAGVS